VQDGREVENIAAHSSLRQDLHRQLREMQKLKVWQWALEAVL